MAQRRGHLEKKTYVYKHLRCGSGARWKRSARQAAHVSNEEVLCLVQEQRSLVQVI